MSDHFTAAYGVEAASLDDVLSTSRVIVIFAAVTSDNQNFLGLPEFERIRPGSAVLLMSRADVVDFPEFLQAVESGRFRAASDVFPIEPAPKGDPAPKVEGLILSRAGALPKSCSRSAVRRWPTPNSLSRVCRRFPAAARRANGRPLALKADRANVKPASGDVAPEKASVHPANAGSVRPPYLRFAFRAKARAHARTGHRDDLRRNGGGGGASQARRLG